MATLKSKTSKYCSQKVFGFRIATNWPFNLKLLFKSIACFFDSDWNWVMEPGFDSLASLRGEIQQQFFPCPVGIHFVLFKGGCVLVRNLWFNLTKQLKDECCWHWFIFKPSPISNALLMKSWTDVFQEQQDVESWLKKCSSWNWLSTGLHLLWNNPYYPVGSSLFFPDVLNHLLKAWIWRL